MFPKEEKFDIITLMITIINWWIVVKGEISFVRFSNRRRFRYG